MGPTSLSALQFTLTLIVFSLLVVWYIAPALNRLPQYDALVPLFLVHALRYLPSTAFAPGQVGADVPMDAMSTIAYGDLASALLALVAALFLRYRWAGALAVAWLVNTTASIDWLNASYLAATNHLVTHPLGGNWYIIHYYVPVIGVVHVIIFARLLRGDRARVGQQANA
jgi:hypothetical protein